MDEVERLVTGTVARRSPREAGLRIEITTLGRFDVHVGGEQVPTPAWGSRRARTLLKRLVVARGWPVTREELIELLWPDETDMGKLGARLSVQLSAVRRVLQGGVVADRSTIAVDLKHVTVDVESFLSSIDPSEIVDRHAGTFLPSESGLWTAPLREEIRTHFTTAAHELMSEASERGDHRTVVELGHRLIVADPYDEAAYVSVASSLTSLGDIAAADRVRERRAKAMTELLRKDS